MPSKISTQTEKLVVVRGAKRVKTLFLSRDVFFIEIWFLNVNWTQNLNFRKILSPQNDLLKSILSKSARTKNFRFKNWSICRKNFHFKIRIFFQKIPFQNLIFNEKVYFRIMPFKISTKIEKLVVFRGGNQVKTLFLRSDVLIDIWFLNINWTQNINFGNYFFSTNWLFKKFRFRNLPERKTFNWKPDILEFFGCFRIWFLFFWKLHFKLWFSMKEFATKSCLLKWARKVKNLLLSAEHIESKRFFSDVNFSWKPDFSVKIELKNWVRGKYFFSRIWLFEKFFIRNLPEQRILNSKTDFWNFSSQISIVQENVCFRIWFLFFWKFHFKLWFSMKKFAIKSCLLKWARKVKNLLLSAEQIESNRYFLDVMFLSKSDSSI